MYPPTTFATRLLEPVAAASLCTTFLIRVSMAVWHNMMFGWRSMIAPLFAILMRLIKVRASSMSDSTLVSERPAPLKLLIRSPVVTNRLSPS